MYNQNTVKKHDSLQSSSIYYVLTRHPLFTSSNSHYPDWWPVFGSNSGKVDKGNVKAPNESEVMIWFQSEDSFGFFVLSIYKASIV